jgi:dTMP kinase
VILSTLKERDLFITFEGIEGCGKTTQIQRLEKFVEQQGIPLITTMEPGGTGIGVSIRGILLDAENKDLAPFAELLLYAADRAQHVEEVIKPALREGKWVLCDRFFDATVAYQGSARGQDMKFIRCLNEKACQGIQPDITFLLDCPVDIGLKRALMRNQSVSDGQDRFEKEKLHFHEKVREGYLTLARKNSKRFIVIDATRSVEGVEKNISDLIMPFIRETAGWGQGREEDR